MPDRPILWPGPWEQHFARRDFMSLCAEYLLCVGLYSVLPTRTQGNKC